MVLVAPVPSFLPSMWNSSPRAFGDEGGPSVLVGRNKLKVGCWATAGSDKGNSCRNPQG